MNQSANGIDSAREGHGRADGENIKLISFYLPQFHPIPENDLWWGKGFTEWTNVTKARPLFEGHYQPHLSSDLGFYDLRLGEVRHEQIALAKQFGIDGFCYHYYWFSGKRLLNRPVDDMLADPESDMPFCLCWANENWTRRWDAADHEILIAQRYFPDDDVNFIKSLVPFFTDDRYIRVKGAPLLIVYRPQQFPNARKTVNVWREYCMRIGIGNIHLCSALTHGNMDYRQFDFDSGVEFPPHNLHGVMPVTSEIDFYQMFQGIVVKHDTVARSYLDRRYEQANVFRTVFPCWDNTPRTGSRSLVIINGTPDNYEYWLSEAMRKTAEDFPNEDRFVFVNAWNEWAEGCHLEPDQRYGRQFLEATLRAKTNGSEKRGFSDTALPGRRNRSFVADMKEVAQYHLGPLSHRTRASLNRFPLLKAALRPVARFLNR
jgi:lipopolysaccharide biosynthesis protein